MGQQVLLQDEIDLKNVRGFQPEELCYVKYYLIHMQQEGVFFFLEIRFTVFGTEPICWKTYTSLLTDSQ